MAYRLSAGSSVSTEVKRILTEEVTSALEEITKNVEKDRDRAIHEARKSVKKLRALLRLVSCHLPRELYRQENQHLREAGKHLSELRDSQAILEAFDAVKADLHLPASPITAARARLVENKQQIETRVDPATVFNQTRQALTEVQARLSRLPLPVTGFSLVEEGLERTYKRGRKARAKAKKAGTTEAFHEWRKRVKEHWYHVRLLAEINNQEWTTRLDNLKQLEGLLGDDHNLAVMNGQLSDSKFGPLTGKLREVSQHLRAAALKLGKEVYGNKWSAVADELRDAHAVWPAKQPRRQAATAGRPAPKKQGAVA